MGWYAEQVLPRVIDRAMRGWTTPVRARATDGLTGEILEIGFGSGLNVPHYPATVDRVRAVEPSRVGRRLAAPRVAASGVPVEFAGLDAGSLPAEDNSIDGVLSTWTLCTVPEAGQALAEIHRVLRPGGSFHFAEHGLAPDPGVARRQRQLDGLHQRLLGGCQLTRPIAALVTGAGLELTRLENYYLPGLKMSGYMYEGIARKP